MNGTRMGDPTSTADGRAVAAIRAWVAVYTKGLPAPMATDRQSLIDGDLSEETQAAEWLGETAGLARQRWSRWLRGVPADITWRAEQQRRITKRPRRTDMRLSKGQGAAIAIAAIYYTVLFVGLFAQPGFREFTGMAVASLGLGLCIAGLLLAIPRPRAGFIVGMIGTGLAFVSMWWLYPFYLPLPIVLGYRLAREPKAAAPSPTGT